jgi:ribosomal protein S18 acetylase RimI-like enzyme
VTPSGEGDFEIRPATRVDVPGILRCLRRAFEPYREEYTPGAWQDTVLDEPAIAARLDDMRVLVAVDSSEEIVGTLAWAAMSETTGHLRGMAVLPDRQGEGVAQSLLERVLAELAREGLTEVTLDTTEPLQRANRFYERNDFQPSGRVSDFFGMRLVERVRRLDPTPLA